MVTLATRSGKAGTGISYQMERGVWNFKLVANLLRHSDFALPVINMLKNSYFLSFPRLACSRLSVNKQRRDT